MLTAELRATFGVIVTGLVLTASRVDAICVQATRLAGDDMAYRYTGAYIDSLGYADQALKRMSVGVSALQKSPTTRGDAYLAMIDALTSLELAAKDFECSASFMATHTQLPMDGTNDLSRRMVENARASAKLTELEYRQLAKLMREYSDIMQAGMKGTLPLNERAGKVAALSAQIQESWGSVFHAVAPTQMLLVDPEPDSAGHMSRLRITEAQRGDLLKSLERTFGSRLRREPNDNTPVPELAAIQLREFLTEKGYTLRK